jgi:hypothetical protein
MKKRLQLLEKHGVSVGNPALRVMADFLRMAIAIKHQGYQYEGDDTGRNDGNPSSNMQRFVLQKLRHATS